MDRATPSAVGMWVRNIVIALGSAGLLVLVVCFSLAANLRESNAGLALELAPWDSRALAQRADELLQPGPHADWNGAKQLATASLARDPTSAPAARILSFAAEAEGDAALRNRLLNYAQQSSRRDLPTQLALINDATARDDARAALHHFDTAMRTSAVGRQILMPILVAATSDARLLKPIVDVLDDRPDWSREFYDNLVQSGSSIESIDTLIGAVTRRRVAVDREFLNKFIVRAVEQNNFGVAARAFERSYGYENRSTGFLANAPAEASGVPFLWQLSGDNGLTAELDADGTQTTLSFELSSGMSGGVAARQLVVLKPGRYRLRSAAVTLDPGLTAHWAVHCMVTDRLVGRFRIQPVGNAPSANDFVVTDASCPATELRLEVASNDQVNPSRGKLDRVELIGIGRR